MVILRDWVRKVTLQAPNTFTRLLMHFQQQRILLFSIQLITLQTYLALTLEDSILMALKLLPATALG